MTTSDLPKNFGIEPTVGCNLECPICAVGCGKMTRPNRLLFFDDYLRLAAKLRPIAQPGRKSLVMLYHQGEPFLNPSIYNIIEDAQEWARVLVHTNGSLKIDTERLARLHVSVCVCIDGLSQKVYEVYRKGGRLPVALGNLIKLHEARGRSGVPEPVEAQILLFKHNQDELFSYMRLMSALGITVRVKLPQLWLNPVLEGTTLEEFQAREPASRDSIRCCGLVGSDLVVQADGQVVSCCYDYNGRWAFGNLFEQDVEEIWNGPHKEFRTRVHSENPPEFCLENCLNPTGRFVYVVKGIEEVLTP